MKRKLLIFFLLVVAVVCIACGLAACDNKKSGELQYELNEDGTYSVSVSYTVIKIDGYETSYRDISGDVVIPSEVDGIAVTAISDSGFSDCVSMTSIVIPDSVIYIGSAAFCNCTSLTNVTIPDSVTYLGDNVFSVCGALNSITIGNGVEFIGDLAFSGCVSMTSVTIPDSVIYIGENAFMQCDLLTSVVVPDSVTHLGGAVFYDCAALKSVSIGSGVEFIGEIPFAFCDQIESVTVSADNLSFKTIDGAVYNTEETTLIYYPCKKEGDEFAVKEGITEISPQAFALSANLKTISLPSTLVNIGYEAFMGCSAEISWSENSVITEIGDRAFYCYLGDSMVLPETVTVIGYNAFQYSAIISITIPKNVNSIYYRSGWGGQAAFYGCNHLVEVYNLSELELTIGEKENGYLAYYAKVIHSSLDEESILFTYENCIFYLYNNEFRLIRYIGTEVDITLPILKMQNYIIEYVIDDFAFLLCNIVGFQSNIETIIIPESVVGIGNEAFECCYELTEVHLPDSLIYIGDKAFAFCSSLETINIPAGITALGDFVFYDCDSLINFEIPDNITEIGECVFGYCDNLESVSTGNNLSIISGSAFEQCVSLKSIVISKSVTQISDYAFFNCTSLTSVYYCGTEDDWSTINIGSNNDYLTSAKVYFYAENDGIVTASGNYWYYDANGDIVTWTVK